MKKFENVYQDAALIQKALLGEANESEQQELEKRLAKCPDLQKVYEQLQKGETLRVAFEEYKNYSSKKAYESFPSENRTNETGGKEASDVPDLVVCCSSCYLFSNRFIFLYVELCFD